MREDALEDARRIWRLLAEGDGAQLTQAFTLRGGRVAGVRELAAGLEAGLDVNARSRDGNSLLLFACYRTVDVRVVELLLSRGASVDLQRSDGCTALMAASAYTRKRTE